MSASVQPPYDALHCGLRLEAYLSGFNLNVRLHTFGRLRIIHRMKVGSSFTSFEHDRFSGLAMPTDPSED
jgi:hypothetical protein